MESLKFNKDELLKEYSDCQKLKDVICELEKSVQKLGRVICQVSVNGLRLTAADEERLGLTDINEIDEIEIMMSKEDMLLKNSMDALQDYLKAFRLRVISASEQFRNNSKLPTAHLFSEIVQSTQLLTDALLTVKPVLFSKVENKQKYNAIWAETEKHFMATVNELATAYQGQDFVLVADVLEYELYNSIEKWLEIISIDC